MFLKIVSHPTGKCWQAQNFPIVRETFPGSTGNISCIKNTFGIVEYGGAACEVINKYLLKGYHGIR
jgi:hypothetical protein